MQLLSRAVLTSVTLSALSLFACKDNTPKITAAEEAAYGSDAADALTVESALFVASLDGAPADSAGKVALTIETNVATRFTPAGCATATGGVGFVAIHFDGCDGPRGLSALRGDLTLRFTSNATTIQAHATATKLAVGSATIDIASDADFDGGNRAIAVMTNGSSTGPLTTVSIARSPAESAAYTVSWTDDCVSLDGPVTATLGIGWDEQAFVGSNDHYGLGGEVSFGTTMRCGAHCPSSGLLEVYGFGKAYVFLKYDGTATPSYSTVGGDDSDKGGSVSLTCAP
jgi:hypothetical protein